MYYEIKLYRNIDEKVKEHKHTYIEIRLNAKRIDEWSL